MATGATISFNPAEEILKNRTADEIVAAVVATAKPLPKATNAPSAGATLFSTRPSGLRQTNLVVLATPPPIKQGEAFTITVVPEPGHRVVGVALVVERAPPSEIPRDALRIFFEQPLPPLLPWKITPRLQLVVGRTDAYRSEAPGPALILRRKF